MAVDREAQARALRTYMRKLSRKRPANDNAIAEGPPTSPVGTGPHEEPDEEDDERRG